MSWSRLHFFLLILGVSVALTAGLHSLPKQQRAQNLRRTASINHQDVHDANLSPRKEQHSHFKLPLRLGCKPRNVTRTIRFPQTDCIGKATFAVCDGYCKTSTRTKKNFPYWETRHKSCRVLRATSVSVPLVCPLARRPNGSYFRRTKSVSLMHAMTCGCRKCADV